MWNILLGPINAIKAALGTPASSTVAAKVDTLHDTRLTSARAGYIDLLNTYLNASVAGVANAVAALDAPPIASGLSGRHTTQANLKSFGTPGPAGTLARSDNSTSTYDSWTSLVSITGSGIIEHLTIFQQASGNASSRDVQARVVIDGNAVWTSATNAWQTPTDDNKGFSIVGDYFSGGATFGHVPYKTSLVVEFKKTENAAGTVAMTACLAATKTS